MQIKNTKNSSLAALSPSLRVDFKALEKRVFYKKPKTGVVFIGGVPIDDQMRETLREETDYILRSNFLEIFDATLTNEAAEMALIQSANMDHVQVAKMLHHLNFVWKNMLLSLAKPK